MSNDESEFHEWLKIRGRGYFKEEGMGGLTLTIVKHRDGRHYGLCYRIDHEFLYCSDWRGTVATALRLLRYAMNRASRN